MKAIKRALHKAKMAIKTNLLVLQIYFWYHMRMAKITITNMVVLSKSGDTTVYEGRFSYVTPVGWYHFEQIGSEESLRRYINLTAVNMMEGICKIVYEHDDPHGYLDIYKNANSIHFEDYQCEPYRFHQVPRDITKWVTIYD